MIKTMLGRTLAAALLCGAAAAALASGYGAAPSSGGASSPIPYLSGVWTEPSGVAPVNASASANKIYFVPFTVRAPLPVAQLGVSSKTGVASSHTSVSVYASAPIASVGYRPQGYLARVNNLATIANNTPYGGTLVEGSGPTLQPNTVYFAAVWSDSAPTLSGTASSGQFALMGTSYLGDLPGTTSSAFTGLSYTATHPTDGTAPTWPTFDGTVTDSTFSKVSLVMPMIGILPQ